MYSPDASTFMLYQHQRSVQQLSLGICLYRVDNIWKSLTHLIAGSISQHGEMLDWECGIWGGQIEVLCLLNIKAHAYSVVCRQKRQGVPPLHPQLARHVLQCWLHA